MSGFENQQGLYLGEPKGCRRLRLSSWNTLTQSYLLWVSGKAAAWAIGGHWLVLECVPEGQDSGGTFSGGRNAGRHQVSSSYYQVQCRRVPFLSLSINLANTVHPGSLEDLPHVTYRAWLPPPKEFLSHHTWWTSLNPFNVVPDLGEGSPVLPSLDGGLGQHKSPSKEALTLGASHTHQCTQNSCS